MNPTTLLYRQVNPSWIQSGRVTSQAFKPTPKDERRLSVYDGDLITPADAWRHYTESLGFSSVGVCRRLGGGVHHAWIGVGDPIRIGAEGSR